MVSRLNNWDSSHSFIRQAIQQTPSVLRNTQELKDSCVQEHPQHFEQMPVVTLKKSSECALHKWSLTGTKHLMCPCLMQLWESCVTEHRTMTEGRRPNTDKPAQTKGKWDGWAMLPFFWKKKKKKKSRKGDGSTRSVAELVSDIVESTAGGLWRDPVKVIVNPGWGGEAYAGAGTRRDSNGLVGTPANSSSFPPADTVAWLTKPSR